MLLVNRLRTMMERYQKTSFQQRQNCFKSGKLLYISFLMNTTKMASMRLNREIWEGDWRCSEIWRSRPFKNHSATTNKKPRPLARTTWSERRPMDSFLWNRISIGWRSLSLLLIRGRSVATPSNSQLLKSSKSTKPWAPEIVENEFWENRGH